MFSTRADWPLFFLFVLIYDMIFPKEMFVPFLKNLHGGGLS
jgi:hypothetical protein